MTWSATRRRCGPQLGFHSATDGGFYSRLTSRENLNFFAAMNNLFDSEAASRIDELKQLMGMGEFIDNQVRTLSTGQVHRLALARAMIHRPSVLLLDEPTRSLDPIAAGEFRRFLKSQVVDRYGTTVLFRIPHPGRGRTTGGPGHSAGQRQAGRVRLSSRSPEVNPIGNPRRSA